MGRHGGGSRSGGSRSRSKSGGVSSGAKCSSVPFSGCYNRSYYYGGVCHNYYTQDKNFGTSKFRIVSKLISVVGISAMVLFMVAIIALGTVSLGEKVHGNPERIMIQDKIDILTPEEEQKALGLFNQVYLKSGMPITLYTDDMGWKDRYKSIEIYSEELYYAMGIEEDAMIILFTYDGTFDWVYDIYCGDDTMKCLSDITFNKLLDNFQKGMAGQNLYNALDHSLNSIMDDLAENVVDYATLVFGSVLTIPFLIVLVFLFSSYLKEKNAYKYFKENPEKIDNNPMQVKPQCTSCGAHNSNFREVCEYCGTVLKL